MLLGLHLRKNFSLSSSFSVLGLKSTSKFDEVKKKYYELAKMHHPDVNGSDKQANNKFAEITKAYKHIVDNYDHEQGYYESKFTQDQKKEKQSGGSAETKFKNQKRQKTRMEEEEYEDFHQYDDFYKNSKKFRKPKVGEDIYLNLNITLQQSILGVQKTFKYTKYEPCSACHDKQFSACFTCGGKTEIYDRINREKVRCEYCSGKGFKNDCSECLGASYVLKEVQDKIYVEKGTKDKTILKVERKGHSGYKANNGHLYITVFIQQNNKFRVDGNNVHVEYDLDYVTATVGGKVKVETVYGMREILIAPGTQSGAEIRLFNLGLKSPFSKRLGDQIMKIRIKTPEKLNRRQRELLQKLCKEQF